MGVFHSSENRTTNGEGEMFYHSQLYNVQNHRGHFMLSKNSLRTLQFENSLGSFSSFPNEILLHMFKNLGSRDVINISMVSKAFFVITMEPMLWKELLQQRTTWNFTDGSELDRRMKKESPPNKICCWKKQFTLCMP